MYTDSRRESVYFPLPLGRGVGGGVYILYIPPPSGRGYIPIVYTLLYIPPPSGRGYIIVYRLPEGVGILPPPLGEGGRGWGIYIIYTPSLWEGVYTYSIYLIIYTPSLWEGVYYCIPTPGGSRYTSPSPWGGG